MYKLTAIANEIKNLETGATITLTGRFGPAYQAWVDAGNAPEPEFTPEELKANATAQAEANARAEAKAEADEKIWQASSQKIALGSKS